MAPEKNDATGRSWIKSDGNSSPLRDDRNTRLQHARKQNGENFQNKLSMKSNISKNIDHVDSENNVHFTTENISRVGKNYASSERVQSTGVFKSRKEQSVNLDEPNHLDITVRTKEYCRLDDAPKKFVSNSSVTTQLGTIYSYQDCELLELLRYNADLMQDRELFQYSFALKEKILEKMSEFEDPEKAELEFLCAITDGTQTQSYLKLITQRKYYVLDRIFKKVPAKPKSSNNCLVPFECLPSYDATSKAAEECNVWYEDVKYERSNSNAPLNEEDSVRFDTEGISDMARKGEMLVADDFECGSISDGSLPGDYSSDNDYANNDFQRIPLSTDSDWKTLHSIPEPLDNNCSMINIRVTKSVSDYIPPYEDSIYNYFRFEHLLQIDVKTLDGSSLMEYAFVLKNKVLEKMDKFSDPLKEKLELLCELTDGTQLEVNQRLITTRMRDLATISL